MTDSAIDYFGGRERPVARAKARVSLWARRRMYRVFEREFRPGPDDLIVDVGVTPDATLADSNAFERFYPHPHRIVATSIENASDLEQLYPGLRFVRTGRGGLPFADRSFAVAHASAVLEHVGSEQAQREFVSELVRVAHAVFVTVPNRWFPVEVHTVLPFLHWLPKPWHRYLLHRLGHDFWAREENLNLLGARDLRRLFPRDAHVRLYRHRLLGLTSNLIACAGYPPGRAPDVSGGAAG